MLIVGMLLGINSSVCNKVIVFSATETANSSLTHEIIDEDSTYKITNISNLKPGDILFKISQYITMHCLLYIGYNSSTGEYEFIEANPAHGVRNVSLSEDSINYLIYTKFGRVKTATATQKQNAILFAEAQIGKDFDLDMFFHNKDHNPNDPNDPYSNKWYCTEIVWAAYYNCNHTPDEGIYGEGIEIDCNGWKKDSLIYSMVWPGDILRDNDVEVSYLRKSKGYDAESDWETLEVSMPKNKEIKDISQIKITQKVEKNAVFAIIPKKYIPPLQKKYFFHVNNEQISEVRWMCSFDTTKEDIMNFSEIIKMTMV